MTLIHKESNKANGLYRRTLNSKLVKSTELKVIC